MEPRSIDHIFCEAAQIAAEEDRATYLKRTCGGDADLRRKLELLLQASAEAESFLESPPAALVATAEPAIGEQSGAQIGPYKLIEQIGEGGMGTVWMAQQSEPVKRLVALKLIKAGMDSRQVIARFEAERQALALMDHPNIARVLDGGTTNAGRPYFVMDLVRGVPITRYCDEHHFTPRQRLELFIPVCQAIQHAHQKGIIHRDLKPNNVLVALYDGQPVPKVIDFGVAKATSQSLTDKTLFTGFGNIVGTLEYMSPEQAELNNQDIDTRSDIYSLGVLLYELLTGTTPLEPKRLKESGWLEALRIIREDEVPTLSNRVSTLAELPAVAAKRGTDPAKLTQLLRGELDWIVMKALEKDRSRRYESASVFAADVQRYLADEPVLACPPSAVYRFRKFARRNRTAMVAGSVAAAVMVLGIAGLLVSHLVVTREKEKVVREKDRGDRHLARVRTVLKQYLADTAEDRRLKAAGLHDLRKALLMSMVAILEEIAGEEGDDHATRVDRSWALFTLANIWREVGETDKALALYDQARANWDRLAADYPHAPGGRIYRAQCDNNRGIVLTDLYELDGAERAILQALETRKQLAKEYPTVADHASGIGGALHSLSLVERRRGNKDEERRLLEQAITHQETAVRLDPMHREARTFLANHHGNLGVVLTEMEKPLESTAANDTARSLFEKLSTDYPDDPEFRSGIAGCWINLGILHEHDRPDEALAAHGQAATVLDRLAAEYPAVPDYRRDLAGVYQNIGLQLSELDQAEEAAAAFDTSLALREQLIKEHPREIDYSIQLAASLVRRGCQVADAGRFDAALKPLGRAVVVLEPLAAPGRGIAGARDLLLRAHGARADALLRLGRHAEAVQDYDRALDLDDGNRRSHFRVERAIALAQLKEHAKAAAEADAVAGEANLPAYLMQDIAAVHAVCSVAARDDAKLSEHYAARAVALLRRAFEKNYMAIASDVRRDKRLDLLRSREDYKKLLTEWEDKPNE